MKNFLLAFLLLSCMMACKKKEQAKKPLDLSGSWYVSFYQVGAADHTSDFSGYTFSFNTDSSFVATKNGVNYPGTWKYSASDFIFNITTSGTSSLQNINEDWLLILKSETEIMLDEDSTVNDEELHFRKN